MNRLRCALRGHPIGPSLARENVTYYRCQCGRRTAVTEGDVLLDHQGKRYAPKPCEPGTYRREDLAP